MKVEFLSDELNGLELVIKGNEFVKATKSDEEFHSLDLAIEAFCNFFCIRRNIAKTEYNQIIKKCKKQSLVIFVVKNDNKEVSQSDIWGKLKAFISTNGINERIF